MKAECGKTKQTVAKKEIGHEFYREVEEKVLVPLTEAMRIRGKLEKIGVDVDPQTPEQMAAFMKEERERWGRVIRENGVKAE